MEFGIELVGNLLAQGVVPLTDAIVEFLHCSPQASGRVPVGAAKFVIEVGFRRQCGNVDILALQPRVC